MTFPVNTLELPKTLSDSLVLRRAAPADIESVASFNTGILLAEGEPPDFLVNWTRTLMSGRHPTMSAADFIVVEDVRARKIVSSTCLIPQVWAYEDIPFTVGRPELVATDPAYRNRGLVRAIFEQVHALSAAYGHQVQAITGIPWFYRQFGYEYALDLGGGRNLRLEQIPALMDSESEPYRSRPASPADIPALDRLYRRYATGKLISVPFDEARWRYELSGRPYVAHTWCLADNQGRLVGAYTASADVLKGQMMLWSILLDEGISMRAVLPGITRHLQAQAEVYRAARNNEDGLPKLAGIYFSLGARHPAYEALDTRLDALKPPYGWYIRVPHLPAFIRHVAPVLERRLTASVMAGFSGDVYLTFYRGGLHLTFDQGRLIAAEDWQDPEPDGRPAGAGFPPLVFLQLLFGYRSLAELRYAFPDCWADEETTLLLNALFPKKESWVIPLA